MSIIIKGIDIPKDGEWLEVIIKPTKEVIVDTIRYRDNALLKTEYEPAIQIPTPHGRLIDIEKLKEEFAMKNNICKECDSFKKCDNKTYSKSEICEKFIWVPTILEAEKEE